VGRRVGWMSSIRLRSWRASGTQRHEVAGYQRPRPLLHR
jgi:hypothetical protein